MYRLDEELMQYEKQLLFMLNKVTQMFMGAKDALDTHDKEMALGIIEMDDYVNHLDEDINHQATEMLSLLQPVAKDLRSIIAGIKLSTDIERIGDYAKNIGRFIIKNDALSTELVDYTNKIIDAILQQLNDVYVALETNDIEAAYQIPDGDEKIDKAFIATVQYIEEEIHMDPQHFKYPVRLITMLRSLERAGDHVKNICESLIYKIKGQHIDFG